MIEINDNINIKQNIKINPPPLKLTVADELKGGGHNMTTAPLPPKYG